MWLGDLMFPSCVGCGEPLHSPVLVLSVFAIIELNFGLEEGFKRLQSKIEKINISSLVFPQL